MKYYLLLIFSLFVLDSRGQDTTKQASTRSISFTAGVNVTYPRSNQFIDGFRMMVIPASGVGKWFEINTNKAFKQTEHSSFGITYGIGYAEYTYTGVASYSEYYTPVSETFPALQKTDEVEINIGFFVNEKITKKIGWYSKIGFLLSGTVYKLYVLAQGPNPDFSTIPPQGALLDLTTQETANIYMLYQTGITIAISKHFAITPNIQIPFINLTSRSLGWSNMLNAMFNDDSGAPDLLDPYNSFRTGIMVTYNFNKK